MQESTLLIPVTFTMLGSFDYSWAIMAGDSTGTATNELNYLTTAAIGQADALGTVTNEQLINWSVMDAYVNDANAVWRLVLSSDFRLDLQCPHITIDMACRLFGNRLGHLSEYVLVVLTLR
jgi:hypothetical protein